MPFIAVASLVAAHAAAQTNPSWTLQAPRPTGVHLQAVHMVSATEAWVGGEQGTLLHTTDGGADWSAWQQQLVSSFNIVWRDISFIDNQRGIAVGDAVIYTVNGGKDWLAGAAAGTFYGVDMVSSTHAWACGTNGRIARTTNGGASWTTQTTPVTAALNAIDFADDQHGWAVGSNGTIIATSNGGVNWVIQNSGTSAFLSGVSFVSPTEGWAAGGNVFLHTTNGGQTWQPQSVPGNTWVYDLDFADAAHGGGAGSTMNIVRTVNGGAAWTTELGGVNTDPTYSSQTFNAISFGDALHAMAVGTGGVIYYSADGGETWLARQNGARFIAAPNISGPSGSPWYGGVFALSDQVAWTAGDVCYTTNGGLTWTDSGAVANDVVFAPDGLRGWLCKFGGVNPMIEFSTDGGRTWQPVTDPDVNLGVWASIDTVDGVNIVAAGWNGSEGRIIRSNDGGVNWTITPADTQTSIYKEVDMVTPTVGYISGGRLLKTVNGGATWQTQTTGVSGSINSVSFSDAANGWFAAANGVIGRTSQGGQPWTLLSPPSGSRGLWDIDAVSPQVAWVSGIGYLGRTINGGQTWTQENVGTTPFEFYDVEFIDAETGWVTSSGAGVHDSSRGGVFRRGGASVAGDVNGDGFVNVSDLLTIINAWGPCAPPPAACQADLTDDGQVSVVDLLIVINNWD